jgi:hypothetical protein
MGNSWMASLSSGTKLCWSCGAFPAQSASRRAFGRAEEAKRQLPGRDKATEVCCNGADGVND